jgi:hypothetical protein
VLATFLGLLLFPFLVLVRLKGYNTSDFHFEEEGISDFGLAGWDGQDDKTS